MTDRRASRLSRALALAGTVQCAALLALSCAPLTFSEAGAIDFERYRSVRVSVAAPDLGGGYAAQYLASRLAESSGFVQVTTNEAIDVDVLLLVDVRVIAPPDDSPDVLIIFGSDAVHAEGEGGDPKYAATAAFTCQTQDGTVVDFGVEEDSSDTVLEVVQDVLDQVELHYIEPYRL